jgi:uncharacterized protein (TIGR02117 family)
MPFDHVLRRGGRRSSLPEMFLRLLCILASVLFAWSGGMETCAGTGTPARIFHPQEPARPVWVAGNGFHAAFILRVEDVSPELRRRLRDRQARWVVIGWGDKQFFMAKPPTVWMTVQAVFWPTPSALHVMPLRRPPEQALAHSDIVRLVVPEQTVARLRLYLDSQFARDRNGANIPLGPGFSASSEFFLGSESFYFPKMCNMWTARGLRRAGIRVAPSIAITAGGLIWQLEGSGQRISSRRRPVDAF